MGGTEIILKPPETQCNGRGSGPPPPKWVGFGSRENTGFPVVRDARSLRGFQKEKAEHNIHSRDCWTTPQSTLKQIRNNLLYLDENIPLLDIATPTTSSMSGAFTQIPGFPILAVSML